MHDNALGGDPVRSSPEIHGYDSLDRLEQDSFERGSPGTDQRAESAYEQYWQGEDNY